MYQAPGGKHRIIFFTDASEIGGAEGYLEKLILGLNREQFNISLLLTAVRGINIWRKKFEGADITVYRLPWRRLHVPIQFFRFFRLFRTADIVHFNMASPASCKWGMLAAILAGVPHRIATYQLVVPYHKVSNLRKKMGSFLVKFLAEHMNRIITVSGSSKADLTKIYDIEPSLISVINNAIDVSEYHAHEGSNTTIGLRSIGPVVCTVGRLHPQKGHRFLIDAARAVLNKMPATRFIFAGSGELEESLKLHAEKLGVLNKIRFLGFRKDIPKILQASDIFVLPSLSEGLPFSILEASAAGKPVIATDVGGSAEAVRHGDTGLVVPPRDPNALSDAILFLLKHQDAAERMGRAGQRRVQQLFNLDLMIRKTEAVYHGLIQVTNYANRTHL